jgi:hypothetical protein
MAAPLTTPRTRPRARKLNSLAVTLSASRGSWSPAIAIPSRGQRSCGIRARQLGDGLPSGPPGRPSTLAGLVRRRARRPGASVQGGGGRW